MSRRLGRVSPFARPSACRCDPTRARSWLREGADTLAFTLNAAIDRREGLQAASQGAISYGFDADDNITAISQNGLTTSISYDGLNRPALRTLPSGANTTWTYDPHGFIYSLAAHNAGGTLIDLHTYTRDAAGNITQEVGDGPTFSYSYDDLYRLSTASSLNVNYSWQYDLAGNRTQQIAGGVTTNTTVNNADQLTAVNGSAVSTDANGNVTQDETGGTYAWDVRGRLKSLTRNGVTSQFGYNQDDLRTSQTVNGTQTTYLLDGESVVQEKTSGTTTDLLQGSGIDNLLERGGEWLTPAGLGSTSMTLDGNGNYLQEYLYQPFGQIAV